MIALSLIISEIKFLSGWVSKILEKDKWNNKAKTGKMPYSTDIEW